MQTIAYGSWDHRARSDGYPSGIRPLTTASICSQMDQVAFAEQPQQQLVIFDTLHGRFAGGKYTIRINWDAIRSTQAELALKHPKRKMPCSVKWHFPLLNHMKEIYHTFKVVVKESNAVFCVHVYSDILKQEAKHRWKWWNSNLFFDKPKTLESEADWCRQEPDREERQRFILKKLLRSKKIPYQENPDQYPPGPINAAMILQVYQYFSYSSMRVMVCILPAFTG